MNSNGPDFEQHTRTQTTSGLTVDLHPVDFEELDSLATELGDLSAVAGALQRVLSSPEQALSRGLARHLQDRLDALSDELRTISMRQRA